MIRSGLIAALLLLPAFHAGAQTRFAVLRFGDITDKLPSYTNVNAWMEAEIRKISQDPRNTQFQKMLEDLTRAVAEARKLPKETDPKTREEVMARVEALKVETKSLQDDLEKFEQEERHRITLKAVAEIEVIEARVLQAVTKVAKERGFDCVFEARGFSSTSMPVVIYAKNPSDLTDDVLAALMAAEPAPENRQPAPANPDLPPSPQPSGTPAGSSRPTAPTP